MKRNTPSNQNLSSVLCVGVGGVGGFYSERFCQKARVGVLARGAHAEHIRTHGLRVRGPGVPERTRLARVHAVYEDACSIDDDYELIVFATKTYQLTDELCRDLHRALPDAGVLSLLNGTESESVLDRFWPGAQVVAGVSRIASSRVGPGDIEVVAGGAVDIAPWQNKAQPLAERVAELLRSVGVSCALRADALQMLWEKLIWNAGFNGVCALTGRRAGELLESPETYQLVRGAMEEVVCVAQGLGVALDVSMIGTNLRATEEEFAATIPSMLQDVRAGRRLEYDAIQGSVVRGARQANVDVPINRALYALLQAFDRQIDD